MALRVRAHREFKSLDSDHHRVRAAERVIRAGVRTDSMIGVTKFRMRKLKIFMLKLKVLGGTQELQELQEFWASRWVGSIGLDRLKRSQTMSISL